MATATASARAKRGLPFSVHTRDLALSKTSQAAISRILMSALGRFARRIHAIEVWLEDVNGPRGGNDTRCRLQVALRPRRSVVVTSLASNEYMAVASAAFRTADLVDNRLKRARSLRRRPKPDWK